METKLSKLSELQLMISPYVVYVWLTVFNLTSYTLSSLPIGHFMTQWFETRDETYWAETET